MTALKTLFLIGLFSIVLAAVPHAYASVTPTPGIGLVTDGAQGGVPIDSSNYKAPQNADYGMENILHSILCKTVGTSPVSGCIGVKADPKTGKPQGLYLYDQIPGGAALGSLSGALVALYTPPTSSVQYVAHAYQNFLGSPVYAQNPNGDGNGAGLIAPVRQIWQASRNIAYIGFILVFVATGFMIMFRQRINPQTVVNIQTALPGLIIGLVLVTFSYLIASLLVDTAFVGTRLVAEFFISSQAPNVYGPNDEDLRRLATNPSIFDLFGTATSHIDIGEVWRAYSDTFANPVDNPGAYGMMAILTALLGGIIGALLGPLGILGGVLVGGTVGPAAITPVVSLIVPVILVLAMLVQLFRLFFSLVTAYIQLLISVIAGPLLILFSSLPGRGNLMGWWWRSILANSLIFPAVFAAFLFAGAILGSPEAVWHNARLPLLQIPGGLIRLMLAYGIILGTPAIPDLVRGALHAQGPQAYAQEAMGAFRAGAQAGQQIGQVAGGSVRLGYRMNAFNGFLNQARGAQVRGTNFRPLGWLPPAHRP